MFGGEGCMEPNTEHPSFAPRSTTGSGLGWLALGIALFGWFLADTAPSSRRVSVDWLETRLYENLVFGSIAAIGVGLGIRAGRVGRWPWLGWLAVGVGGALVIRSVANIARWL
jgi:hypothetical protein